MILSFAKQTTEWKQQIKNIVPHYYANKEQKQSAVTDDDLEKQWNMMQC